MAVRLAIVASTLFLLMVGCVPVVSLNHYFPKGDSVFDPSLLGKWVDDEGKMSVDFSRSDGSSYLVSLTIEAETYRLRGHLLPTAGSQLLDLSPLEPDDDGEKRLLKHLMPFHTIHRIRREQDALEFASLDGDWLGKQIEAGEIRIDHVVVDEFLVLTAPTETLQSLLRQLKQDEAFPKAGVLRRKP